MARPTGQAAALKQHFCSILGWGAQAATYRKMDPELRAENIKELARQLDILETYVTGPFVLGNEVSCADIAILPTLVSCIITSQI